MSSKQRSVTMYNAKAFFLEIEEMLGKTPLLSVTISDGSVGKWSMTRLWRSWMGSTAKAMAANGSIMPLYIKPDGTWYGKRPFNQDDAHELFTRQYLGTDKDGKRLSWAKTPCPGEVVASKGERFIAMQQHQAWMTEKGIQHMVPRDSEYYEELQKANGLAE